MSLPTVLEKICERKFEEIAERQRDCPIEQLQELTQDLGAVRNFTGALQAKIAVAQPAVIAEVKKASPSKGVIRQDFVPKDIARSYEDAGAACLSVLTDKDYFQGSEDFLKQARAASSLPTLRKDFTVDAYQVFEARYIGADAILLIVAALTQEKLFELYELAVRLGLHVLIEVHDQEELSIALKTDNPLLGINNRNLHNFETKLETTLELLASIDDSRLVITESGICTREQVQMMRSRGVNGFLVGEAFMRCSDPGAGLQELFF